MRGKKRETVVLCSIPPHNPVSLIELPLKTLSVHRVCFENAPNSVKESLISEPNGEKTNTKI